MKAKGFRLEEVINPESGELTKRVMVTFEDREPLKLFAPDLGETADEKVVAIKKDKAAILAKGFNLMQGEFGEYCMPKAAVLLEEF